MDASQPLRRRATVAGAALAAAALGWACPAGAADPPPCAAKGKQPVNGTCVITWQDDAFDPVHAAVRTGVPIVFSNANGRAPLAGAVTVSWPVGEATESVRIEPGAHSDPVTFSGGSPVRLSGNDESLGRVDGEGTITLVAAASPSPRSSPAEDPTQKRDGKRDGNGGGGAAGDRTGAGQGGTKSPKPSPSAAAAGQGVTNPPPLGSGTTPGPTPSADPPVPLVAPGAPLPTPSATPSAAVVTDVPRTLAQPVEARRLGLPGALAGVLLVGVAVGVVRLARAEYAALDG